MYAMPDGFTQRADGLFVPEHLTQPGRADVYCDESGNSGPNYLDQGQPFYVLGGWLVPEDRVVDVNVAIDQFRQKHFPQLQELKTSSILRNDRTKRAGAELFRILGQLHCVPLYLIAEKRYCVAGKIVETFLDPAFNELVRDPITSDVETKQEIANTLYEQLDRGAMDGFAQAYMEPTPGALDAALTNVVSAIDRDISEALGRALLGSRAHMDAIAKAEGDHWLSHNLDATLNLPCLISFLMLVENLGRLGLARPIRVIHDEHQSYEEGYKQIFELHRGMPRLFARLPHNDAEYSNLEHVAVFETRTSISCLPIQAADILAGVLGHCCKLAMGDGPITDADNELIDMLIPGMISFEPRLTWMVCSDHCLRRIGSRLFQPSIRRAMPDIPSREVSSRAEMALAPMFPSKASSPVVSSEPRVSLDVPLYGIVGKRNGGLFILVNDPDDKSPMGKFAVLFSERAKADAWLAMWKPGDLTEPQEVVEFGPAEIPALATLLWETSEWVEAAAFDPKPGQMLKLLRLDELAEGLGKKFDRVRRLYAAGLDRVLTERVPVGSREALVMQASDGRFGALFPPRGKIYFGSTREEAIMALKAGERLLSVAP